MTPQPRFITKPGCTCVCKDCGAPLELACPNGHNPGQYILGTDEVQPLPCERPQPAPTPQAAKVRPAETGICEEEGCDAEFKHEKRPGRRFRKCPAHREAKA